MSERRYADVSLAAALIAGGATLVRTEPGRRVSFVLSPPDGGPSLVELERAHDTGALVAPTRSLSEIRFALHHLLRLARAGDDGADHGRADAAAGGDVSQEATPDGDGRG